MPETDKASSRTECHCPLAVDAPGEEYLFYSLIGNIDPMAKGSADGTGLEELAGEIDDDTILEIGCDSRLSTDE